MSYFDAETHEEISDDDMYERYDDMLDDVYGEVQVAGMEYSTSSTLAELDPTAYRCGFHDYIDAEEQDGTIYEDDEPRTDDEEG